jgi:hypothetical protein
MYEFVLLAHAWWRWVVLLAGIVAICAAVRGWVRGLPWAPGVAYWGKLFGLAVDVQFLLGVSLYMVFSPMTNIALNVAEGLPAGSDLLFFGVYHGLIMTVAFIDVHVSAVIVRRGGSDAAKRRRSVVLYGQTLAIIIATTPWWRPLFPTH